jgi:hypothetical protein
VNPYPCGGANNNFSWDPGVNPGAIGGPSALGAECLIHASSAGLGQNQDVLTDPAPWPVGPRLITTGTGGANPVTTAAGISETVSIADTAPYCFLFSGSILFYKPKGLDRASLLRFYLSQIEGVRWKEPLPYSERLEREIDRIAHLPYPQRTMRSIALWEAFRDAKTVGECIRQGRAVSEEWLKCEASVNELMRKVKTGEWRTHSRSLDRLES